MKKAIIGLVVSLMLVMTVAMAVPKPVSTYEPYAKNNGPAGKSKMSHLYLIEKNPSDWTIVKDGAWGKRSFDSDSFVFNGHGLEAATDYTLIRYTDPWPGSPVCLASGTSNDEGDVHLSDAIQTGGPKVWLVLSSDVNCGVGMTGWNPTEYLFEYDLI